MTFSQSSADQFLNLLQKYRRSRMFFLLSKGFFAGLRAFNPLQNKRLLIVQQLTFSSFGSCDWIFEDDALGDRLHIRRIELSVLAEVTLGRPLRFLDTNCDLLMHLCTAQRDICSLFAIWTWLKCISCSSFTWARVATVSSLLRTIVTNYCPKYSITDQISQNRTKHVNIGFKSCSADAGNYFSTMGVVSKKYFKFTLFFRLPQTFGQDCILCIYTRGSQ